MISKSQLLNEAKARYKHARKHCREWRIEAKRCYDFFAGRQWEEKDRTDLLNSGRAPIVLNRVKPIVLTVCGIQSANRQEIKYEPRDETRTQSVDILNSALSFIRQGGDIEDEESDMFRDSVITGMGWTHTYMDYDDDIDGKVKVDKRECMRYDWDWQSRKQNLVDRRFQFYTDDLDPDEFKARYPDRHYYKTALGVGDTYLDAQEEAPEREIQPFYPEKDSKGEHNPQTKARVVEYQFYKKEARWRCAIPDSGELVSMSPEKAKKWQVRMEKLGVKLVFQNIEDETDEDNEEETDQETKDVAAGSPSESDGSTTDAVDGFQKKGLDGAPVEAGGDARTGPESDKDKYEDDEDAEKENKTKPHNKFKDDEDSIVVKYVIQYKRIHYIAEFTGDQVLTFRENACPDYFVDNCITGDHDDQKRIWTGIVKSLLDPQLWINKFFSQAIYIYTVNPKGGAFVEKDAVDNPFDFESKFAQPDAVTWVKSGALTGGKITERKPGNYPTDLDKLAQYAIESLPALSGISPELMGITGKDQPGVLEHMRKQAGMTILASLFNSVRRYHKIQGRLFAHFISTYMNDGRMMKIVRPNERQFIKLALDYETLAYDVVVDEAPISPNQKEYVLDVLTQMTSTNPELGALLAPLFLQFSPLPADLVNQVKQEMEQAKAKAQGPTPEQIKQAMQEMQRLQQENQDLKQKVKDKSQELQLKATEAQQTLQLKAAETPAYYQLEIAKIQSQATAQQEKLMLEFKTHMEKLREEMQIEIMKLHSHEKIEEEKIASHERTEKHKAAVSASATVEASRNKPKLNKDKK